MEGSGLTQGGNTGVYHELPAGIALSKGCQEGSGAYVLVRYSRIPVAQAQEYEYRIPPG